MNADVNAQYVLTPNRIRILEILRDEGGEICDGAGQATSQLMARSGHNTTNALSGMLMAMENDGLIVRDLAGRRTYSIRLTALGKQVAEGRADVAKIETVVGVRVPAVRRPGTIAVLQAEIERLVDELKVERERNDRLIGVIDRLAQSAA